MQLITSSHSKYMITGYQPDNHMAGNSVSHTQNLGNRVKYSSQYVITSKIISEQNGISHIKSDHRKHKLQLPKVDGIDSQCFPCLSNR